VRPDKHPDHRAEAEAATARVNQARDVRCRYVTEV
jgi:curved DNA-binding protein CbpA